MLMVILSYLVLPLIDELYSFNEKVEILDFGLYPNPTQDLVFLDGSSSKIKFRLYSLNAGLVKSGETESSISLSNQPAEIYVFEMENKSKVKSQFEVVKF